MARAVASQLDANFLKVVSSAIVDKYIGESARLIREMFNYARDHQPCIIFMDEIDAIGGRRFSEGTSADREIQRTLMELLNQMDGFDVLGKVKMIMATNRPDTLDPALLRPGKPVQPRVKLAYNSKMGHRGRAPIQSLHENPHLFWKFWGDFSGIFLFCQNTEKFPENSSNPFPKVKAKGLPALEKSSTGSLTDQKPVDYEVWGEIIELEKNIWHTL